MLKHACELMKDTSPKQPRMRVRGANCLSSPLAIKLYVTEAG